METKHDFSTEVKKITLTVSERENLRGRLLSYISYYPLPIKRLVGRPTFVQIGGHALNTLFHARKIMSACALMVVLVFIPFVAEQSLPGDTLYPVKVRFNEEIQSQLLSSPYEKIQWETERVGRRVAEAQILLAEGKLTKENADTLNETARLHTDALKTQLAEFRADDATGATVAEVALESALDVQSAVLDAEIAHEASSTSPNEGGVSDLAAIVREARDGVVASGIGAVGSTTEIYAQLTERISTNKTRIETLSQSFSGELTDEQQTSLQGYLTNIDTTIATAQTASTTDIDTTVVSLRDTLAQTEKIVAFLSDFDVRSNVSLQSLISEGQKDPSPADVLNEKLTQYKEKQASYKDLSTIVPIGQKQEVTEKLNTLGVLMTDLQKNITDGNGVNAEQKVQDIETLITELGGYKKK